MSARRPAQCLLASVLVAALAASACVDAVVVGTQRSPISALDASDDASTPELDAAEPDAHPPPSPDAASDAAPPQDAGTASDSGPPPADASEEDAPIVIYVDADAGQDAMPEAGPLGPCFSCDVTVSISMTDQLFDACPDGLDELCWQNPDDTCSVQCPSVETCSASSDCTADEYCYFARSDCGATTRGRCAPRPTDECTGVGNQVCGCDGMIYETGCHARRAGVAVAGPGYEGRCPPVLEF